MYRTKIRLKLYLRAPLWTKIAKVNIMKTLQTSRNCSKRAAQRDLCPSCTQTRKKARRISQWKVNQLRVFQIRSRTFQHHKSNKWADHKHTRTRQASKKVQMKATNRSSSLMRPAISSKMSTMKSPQGASTRKRRSPRRTNTESVLSNLPWSSLPEGPRKTNASKISRILILEQYKTV